MGEKLQCEGTSMTAKGKLGKCLSDILHVHVQRDIIEYDLCAKVIV